MVRRALLRAAERIAARDGFTAVTIDAVSAAAGVTKGGLFHHFPSKRALISGLIETMLAKIEEEMARLMVLDREPRGRFTRAYVGALFADLDLKRNSPWAALVGAMFADAHVRDMWSAWLSAQLETHTDDDRSRSHAVIRMAADGGWSAAVFGFETGFAGSEADLKDHLIEMTKS